MITTSYTKSNLVNFCWTFDTWYCWCSKFYRVNFCDVKDKKNNSTDKGVKIHFDENFNLSQHHHCHVSRVNVLTQYLFLLRRQTQVGCQQMCFSSQCFCVGCHQSTITVPVTLLTLHPDLSGHSAASVGCPARGPGSGHCYILSIEQGDSAVMYFW